MARNAPPRTNKRAQEIVDELRRERNPARRQVLIQELRGLLGNVGGAAAEAVAGIPKAKGRK